MIHRRVLPERPDLVHDRKAQPLPGAQRGQRGQHRGVRVEEIGRFDRRGLLDPPRERVDERALSHEGDPAHGRRPRPVVGDASDHLVGRGLGSEVRLVFGGSDGGHIPPSGALREQDALTAEGVPAVHGKAVIQNVQDSHQTGTRSPAATEARTSWTDSAARSQVCAPANRAMASRSQGRSSAWAMARASASSLPSASAPT